MTGPIAPKPLLHSASPRLREALLEWRRQGPSASELGALFDRVTESIAADARAPEPQSEGGPTQPPSGAIPATEQATTAAVAQLRKLALGTSILLLAGFGGWSLARMQSDYPRSALASRADRDRPVEAKPIEPAPAVSSPATFEQGAAPKPEARGAEMTGPAQRARATEQTRTRARPVATDNAWLDDSAAENALLEPAVRDLRARRFEAVLARAEAHELRFPYGGLRQTRELLAIEALLGLDRRPEALQRAVRFRQTFPDSLYREKLDTLLSASP
jgi:hypothetical protein